MSANVGVGANMFIVNPMININKPSPSIPTITINGW